jgi:transcriptional regulator with XRE-family HTH domain
MTTRKPEKTEKKAKLWANTLKDRIVFARGSSGISQTKLAENLDIHVTTLSKYERGKRVPDANILNRIAEVTRCPPGWLLSGGGDIEGKATEGESKEVTAKYISLLEQNIKKLEKENERLREKRKSPQRNK